MAATLRTGDNCDGSNGTEAADASHSEEPQPLFLAAELGNRLDTAEKARVALERQVQVLQDLLDEAHEQLAAQMRLATPQAEVDGAEGRSLADELGGAMASEPGAGLVASEVDGLLAQIEILQAERERIAVDMQRREHEVCALADADRRLRAELEHKYQASLADLEKERMRRADAERAAKTAWEQAQALLAEAKAIEETKRRLRELEDQRDEQRTIIAILEVCIACGGIRERRRSFSEHLRESVCFLNASQAVNKYFL